MKRFYTILMAVMAFGVFLAMPIHVSAASNSLGVNPRRDYVVKPGETLEDILNVTNLHKSETLYITIRPIDFKAGNETGSPQLLLKQSEPTRWSLKPFLTIPETYAIPAGKSVDVPFSVKIPNNLGGGSYYSAIHYTVSRNAEAAGGSNLNLTGSSVSLLFIRVLGDAKSSLILQRFGAFTPAEDLTSGTYATFYGATKPKYLAYTLKNTGNIVEEPHGSLELRNIFGKQVKLYEDINPHNSLVVLEQTRRIDFCMNEAIVKQQNEATGQEEEVTRCNEPKLLPGRYTANMALLYGDNGSPSSEIRATTSFWYLPVWFIVSVITGLLLVAFLIWKSIRKIKSIGKPTYGTRRR